MLTTEPMDSPAAVAAGRGHAWISDLVEASFAFLIFLPTLFVVQLRSAAPALTFGFIILYAAARRRDVRGVLAQRWLLLIIPALALVSVIWSEARGDTLKHGAELTVSVGGALLLSGSRRPAAVLIGTWAAFALFMLVSLALGGVTTMTSMVSGNDSSAFAGLNGLKNLFGMTAAISVLLSLFLAAYWGGNRSRIGLVCVLAVLAVELYLVWAARSAGAIIGLALATAAFAATALLKAIRPGVRGAVCGILAVALAGAGALGYAFANSVTATALNLFHKDPTLTGREYLWYRAHDLIREHPLLGRGFEAFWVQGNPDAEGLWQYGQISDRYGFNFHNTLIEMLIHFGWIGTTLLLLVFLGAFAWLVRRCIREPSVVASFCIAFVVFELTRTPFESLTPQSYDFATILMFMALGLAFHAPDPEPVRVALRQPVRRYRRLVATPARHAIWSGRVAQANDDPQPSV